VTLPQIISRNQIQRIPSISLNVVKSLSGGTDGDFYTVPTGKKALIKGTAECPGAGAAAQIDLNVAGISIAEWQSSGGGTDPFDPQNLQIGALFPFSVQLDAGEILQYSQNAGTNAEMTVIAEILETPA